jgi:hypothetical protein
VRAPGVAGLGRDELVNERVLSGCWPEHPTNPLDVLALSLAARDDDGEPSVGHVDSLVDTLA